MKIIELLWPLIKLIVAATVCVSLGLLIAVILEFRREFWMLIKEKYHEVFRSSRRF